jgi:hypothetical protein
MEVSTMSTETQINANRLNAQKSTGPKTPEGKEKVSQNAVTHGLTALRPVLANEDPNEYALFRDDFFRHHTPAGILEEALVERAAESFWRLCRASTFETQVLNNLVKESQNPQSDTTTADKDAFAEALLNDFRNTHVLERLLGYEMKIERSYYRTVKELRQLQSQRLNNVGEASPLRCNSENSKNEQNKAKIPSFDPVAMLENMKSNPIDLDPLTKIMMKKDNFQRLTKKAM